MINYDYSRQENVLDGGSFLSETENDSFINNLQNQIGVWW